MAGRAPALPGKTNGKPRGVAHAYSQALVSASGRRYPTGCPRAPFLTAPPLRIHPTRLVPRRRPEHPSTRPAALTGGPRGPWILGPGRALRGRHRRLSQIPGGYRGRPKNRRGIRCRACPSCPTALRAIRPGGLRQSSRRFGHRPMLGPAVEPRTVGRASIYMRLCAGAERGPKRVGRSRDSSGVGWCGRRPCPAGEIAESGLIGWGGSGRDGGAAGAPGLAGAQHPAGRFDLRPWGDGVQVRRGKGRGVRRGREEAGWPLGTWQAPKSRQRVDCSTGSAAECTADTTGEIDSHGGMPWGTVLPVLPKCRRRPVLYALGAFKGDVGMGWHFPCSCSGSLLLRWWFFLRLCREQMAPLQVGTVTEKSFRSLWE